MIRRSKLQLWLCGLLTAVAVCFIWGNSLLPADESSQVSGWFGAFIGKLLPMFSPENPNGSHLLRKFAHFTEFALLGTLLCWGSAMLLKKKPAVIGAAFLCGAAVAAIDETIQRFIPGRCGCLADALLDSVGVLTGTLAVFVLILLLRKSRACTA